MFARRNIREPKKTISRGENRLERAVENGVIIKVIKAVAKVPMRSIEAGEALLVKGLLGSCDIAS